MEGVVPLALVWVLCVSAAPFATRRRDAGPVADAAPDPHSTRRDAPPDTIDTHRDTPTDTVNTRRDAPPDPLNTHRNGIDLIDGTGHRDATGQIIGTTQNRDATRQLGDATKRRDVADDAVIEEDDDFGHYDDEEKFNISEPGMYLGSPCAGACNPRLVHVSCEAATGSCACEPRHTVVLGVNKGCAKPKKLGEQCFYRQTCRASDAHSSCVQVNHNAYCQCDPGYHSTSHSRPTTRVFCTEDLVLLTADMPTLLGVASGIFVLGGLLCMVLHLYSKARYQPTHLADARLTPPCLYSLNDTGGTLSASRASSRSGRTSGTLEDDRRRRAATPASRAGAARAAAILLISRHLGGAHPPKCAAKGSRRPSLSSVQSSSSSIRSYSAKRWEREREQKERRQMSMRLAQLHDKMAAGRELPKHAPTPSPRSPNNSTDGLLPSVCEIRELLNNPEEQLQGVDGPCTSSSLY